MYSSNRRRVTFNTGSETLVKQAHKAECDINNILAQYKRTGIITHVRNTGVRYEDLPDEIDFQTALHIVRDAEEAFLALPASVRERFQNDPAQLLAALHDPARESDLADVGIITKAAKEAARAAAEGAPAPEPGEAAAKA